MAGRAAEASRFLGVLESAGRLGGARLGIVILSTLHVLLLLVALTVGRALPREAVHGNWEDLVFTGPGSELISFWQRWDTLWYQHIAQEGYRAGDGSTAFFPLYPMLVRLVSIATLGNAVVAGLIVSGTALVAAFAAFWKLTRFEAIRAGWGDSPALPTLGALLVAAFPTAFFLVAPYTESLFLALAIATLYFARTGRPWVAAVLGLLASLSRAQGIFLALPIAWEVLRRGGGLDWLARSPGGRRPGLAILASLLPVAGLVGLALYQRVVIGEARTGFEALALWGYQLALPWEAVAASWLYVARDAPSAGAALVEVFNLASLLGGLALAVVVARRLPVAYTLYAVPSLLLLAFREMGFSPLMSLSRYVLVVFPLFLVATPWLARRPRVAVAVLVAGLLTDLALFQYFVRWGFVA